MISLIRGLFLGRAQRILAQLVLDVAHANKSLFFRRSAVHPNLKTNKPVSQYTQTQALHRNMRTPIPSTHFHPHSSTLLFRLRSLGVASTPGRACSLFAGAAAARGQE